MHRRIADFLDKRGIVIWSGLIRINPVPNTIRDDILEGDHECMLCGASPETDNEVRLYVDHIVPRSKGGLNDFSNL